MKRVKIILCLITCLSICIAMIGCDANPHDASLDQESQPPKTTVSKETESPTEDDESAGGLIDIFLKDPADRYMERSNMQKDDAAMGEVANAITLSLLHEEIVKEISQYAIDNVGCYIDSSKESNFDDCRIAISNDKYYFNDDAREKSKTPYYFAGKIYGLTITFKPTKNNGECCYKLSDGMINIANNGNTKLSECTQLYQQVLAIYGDDIVVLDSIAYGNSDYTIFVRVPSNTENKNDAFAVYGQFNGEYLSNPQDGYQIAN